MIQHFRSGIIFNIKKDYAKKFFFFNFEEKLLFKLNMFSFSLNVE